MELLKVRASGDRSDHVIELEGELDLNTFHAFIEAIEQVPDEPGLRVIVDLCQLSFMDSSGIGGLLAIRGQCIARDQRLVVVSDGYATDRVLDLTALTEYLTVVRERPEPRSGSDVVARAISA